MKIVTIQPVAKPKSFETVTFTEAEYKAAVKVGAKQVPYPTALEALKYGRGLYQIKVEKTVIEYEIKGMKEPDEMTPAELVAEMTSHGKPPRKRIERKQAVAFVKELRAKAVEMIIDDTD